jgi:dihydrofolate reductase
MTVEERGAGGSQHALLVSLVVAATDNDVIGRDQGMPWHLPDDLRRFKELTLGRHLLLGRRTFESIGRPLPGRTTLVLTRDARFAPAGVTVVRSLDEAFSVTVRAGAAELVIGGGAVVYQLALPYVRRIYLTRIHAVIDGDTRLPPIDWARWRLTACMEHPADARHEYAMSFMTLERNQNDGGRSQV